MLSVFNVWQIGITTAGVIYRAQNGFDLERRFCNLSCILVSERFVAKDYSATQMKNLWKEARVAKVRIFQITVIANLSSITENYHGTDA